MKLIHSLITSIVLLGLPLSASGQLEDFIKGLDSVSLPKSPTLITKIVSGLKEALQVGTEKTVNLTGATDGFLKNEAIKILLPAKLQSMDKALRVAGFGPRLTNSSLA